MKEEWHIRRANHDDSAGLQDCMQLAYSGYEERMAGERLPPMNLDYSSEIRDFPTWVAESGGTIVGGLTMIFESDSASVANIGVRPECQGQGLGKGLLNHAEIQAKERGYSDLNLSTHALLHENVSLYLHLGWSEVERDESRIKMKKSVL